ncbi:hypothetical protein [Bradyrhizobium canariense]|uniref:hypothetical protein n=1 Tax=Bradyrhizobium canariense TaxID=255045 RepID=UPI001CA54651|nr:hypothetical protein [Bradyrhizobium canariense]
MNMFVSSAAAAGAPAVAMNLAPHEPVVDHQGILARVEQIVDVLRTRYICEGWQMDEDGAARALNYFRRHVEGPGFKDEDEDTLEFTRVLEFFRSHGQSLDWAHDGDLAGMICRLAKVSPRGGALGASCVKADPTFAEIEAHKKASADYSAAIRDVVPGTLDPDTVKEETFGDREAEVRHELATSVPTTLPGLLAMLTYVEDVSSGKYSASGRPDNAFDRNDLLNVIVRAQDCLRDHSAGSAV